MKEVLYAIDQENEQAVKAVMEKAPLHLRQSVRQAYEAFMGNDTPKSIAMCEKVLSAQADYPDLECLLVQNLYRKMDEDSLKRALSILKDLRNRYPDDKDVYLLMGKVYHAMDDYKNAVAAFSNAFPLERYEPFACQTYADSLEHTNQHQKALMYYRMDLEEYEKTGIIYHPIMLDASFQNALLLDIRYNAEQFQHDLELYKKFILQTDTTGSRMQTYISDTVIRMSMELSKKWLRKPFIEFLDYLSEHDILHDIFSLTVQSGYESAESYYIHEDHGITSFTEDYLVNVGEYKNDEAQENVAGEDSFDDSISYRSKEDRYMNKIAYLSYNWYMSRYYEGHEDELAYVKNQYPHTWETVADSIDRIAADPEVYQRELIEEIHLEMKAYGKPQGKMEIINGLEEMYEKAIAVKKEPVYLADGLQTYHREKKIGRNDPCPCGSGKKYKKCCGR